MTSARFKWTRKRYYKAKHLSRLLSRLDYYCDKPPIVERYIDLCDKLNLRDPLTIPLAHRLPDNEIPF